MDKIGVLSIYHNNHNFGGMLQAYALCEFLNVCGYNAEQICVDFTYDDYWMEQIRKHNGWKKIRAILSFIKHQAEHRIKKIKSIPISKDLEQRNQKFCEFEESIPHSSEIYTIHNIGKTNDIYDLFVCGSDVIWNCGMPAVVAALGFSSKKKIAYAPSVGTAELPDWWVSEYLSYVKQFDRVSMREESACRQLEEVIDKPVFCAADPTFLLMRNQWESLVSDVDSCIERECFCYLLGNNISQREGIKNIAKELNLTLVTEPFSTEQVYQKCDYHFGDIQDFMSGPKEFLAHIKNADIIFTDSFHACVFAIIFNKEFYAVPRLNGKNGALSGRIKNLLSSFGLEDKYIENLSEFKRLTCDYNRINNKLEEMQHKSADFLLEGILE